MLGDNRISAVLVSTDLERSQAFYEHKVGLTLCPETIKNHLVFDGGNGTTLLIYGRGGGNTPDHTQVRFWSSDVAKDVAELVGRGVEFEEYDSAAFKTVDQVLTSPGIGRSAWFKDPDGDTIAIFPTGVMATALKRPNRHPARGRVARPSRTPCGSAQVALSGSTRPCGHGRCR